MSTNERIAVRAAEHQQLAAALGQSISDETAMARAILETGQPQITVASTPFLDALSSRQADRKGKRR